MKKAPRFGRGATLAWMLQSERTYRELSPSDWQLSPVVEVSRSSRGFNISAVIEGEHEVPDVRIEPQGHGMVRFIADFPLLVLRDGETTPHLAGAKVDVPYGSVVMAGPALLAPLDAAQAREVRAGTLELQHIEPQPLPHAESLGDAGDLSMAKLAAALRWGRMHRLAFVVAAACVFLFGFVAYRMMTPPIKAHRVLVALQGLPEGDEELIRLDIDTRLRTIGLEPVFFDTLVTPSFSCQIEAEEVDDLQDCARSMGAPQVVSLSMSYSQPNARGRLASHVVRIGRVRPFEAHTVELESSIGSADIGELTAMWGFGLDRLEPVLLDELARPTGAMSPSTPLSFAPAF